MGKRTRIQIELPDIIKIPFGEVIVAVALPATKDKELGTNQRHSMIATTTGPGTIGHDAGPLSRCWNIRGSDQLLVEWVLT